MIEDEHVLIFLSLIFFLTQKMDPVKKVFSGRSLPAEYGLSLSKLRTALTALRSENRNNSSRNRVDTKNISHIPKSRSITIQEVPSTVGLPQLIEAISVFGVISRASMRTVPYGLDCCDVEFEVDSSIYLSFFSIDL